MICKRFPSEAALRKTILALAAVAPDCLGFRVLWVSTPTENWLFLTEKLLAKIPNEAISLGASVSLENNTLAEKALECRLFELLPRREISGPVPSLYFLISEKDQTDFLSECLRISLFEIQMVSWSGYRFYKVHGAGSYLAQLAVEKFGAEVFSRDAVDVFHPFPWEYEHLNRLGNKPGSLLLLSKAGKVLLEDAEFVSVYANIRWQGDFEVSHISAQTGAREVTIPLKMQAIKADNRLRVLWVYEASKLPYLLSWIEDLPVSDRDKFYVLMLQDETIYIKSRVPMVQAPESFRDSYVEYGGSNHVLIRDDLRLRPPLPATELLKVFQPVTGSCILLDSGKDFSLKVSHLSILDFKPLEELVRYKFEIDRDRFSQLVSGFRLDDPQIEIYDLEEIEILKQETGAFQKQFGSQITQTGLSAQQAGDRVAEILGHDSEPEELVLPDEVEASVDELPQDTQLLHREIQELQKELRNSIGDGTSKKLTRMAQCYGALGDYANAVSHGDLAAFFTYPQDLGSLGQNLFLWWQEMTGRPESLTLPAIFRETNNSLGERDLSYLTYYIMDKGSSLNRSETRWMSERLADSLMVYAKDMPLVKVLVFLFAQQKTFGTDLFRLLKLRDLILARIFDRGLAHRVEVPEFLLKDEDLESQFYQGMQEAFADLKKRLPSKSTELLICHLNLACLYAVKREANFMEQALSGAEQNLAPRGGIREVLYRMYNQRARQILAQEPIKPEIRDMYLKELSSQDAYRLDRFLRVSLIFEPSMALVPNEDEWNHKHRILKKLGPEELIARIPLELSKVVSGDTWDQETASYRRANLWSMILEVLPRTGQDFSLKVMKQIQQSIDELKALEHRANVLGRMVAVASLFQQEDLKADLSHDFFDVLQRIEPDKIWVLEKVLVPMLNRFSQLLDPEELKRALEIMESRIRGQDLFASRAWVLVGVLRDKTGEPEICQKHLMLALNLFFAAKTAPNSDKLKSCLFILRGTRDCSVPTRLFIRDQILKRFDEFTDTMSTNSFMVLSKVLAMEYLAVPGLSTDGADLKEGEISSELKLVHLQLESLWKQKANEQYEYLKTREEH